MEINPAPTHKLVVHGNKDVRLGLEFRLGFIARNDTCAVHNFIEGVDVSQTQYDKGIASIGTSEFSIEFYTDKYFPGTCHWHPFVIMLCPSDAQTNSGGCSGFASIDPDATNREAYVQIACRPIGDGKYRRVYCQPTKRLPPPGVPILATSGANIRVSASYIDDK